MSKAKQPAKDIQEAASAKTEQVIQEGAVDADLGTLSAPAQGVNLAEEKENQHRVWLVLELGEHFAQALLQNPSIEMFLRGPFLDDPTRIIEDRRDVGAYLAHRCHILAESFLDEAERYRLAAGID